MSCTELNYCQKKFEEKFNNNLFFFAVKPSNFLAPTCLSGVRLVHIFTVIFFLSFVSPQLISPSRHTGKKVIQIWCRILVNCTHARERWVVTNMDFLQKNSRLISVEVKANMLILPKSIYDPKPWNHLQWNFAYVEMELLL